MKKRFRYYFNADGLNDIAIESVINKAIEIAQQNLYNSRIVFIGDSPNNDGWVERKYSRAFTKKWKRGTELPGTQIFAISNSRKNYNPSDGDIIISLGLLCNEILMIEDYDNIRAIIALPSFMTDNVNKWARITNAINIEDNIGADSIALPPCIVMEALKSLTNTINITNGISHSSDENLAKTYLRALTKYKIDLPEDEIESYLFKELNWKYQHTNDLLRLIKTINSGRWFQGGNKTGLKDYIKNWRVKCNQK